MAGNKKKKKEKKSKNVNVNANNTTVNENNEEKTESFSDSVIKEVSNLSSGPLSNKERRRLKKEYLEAQKNLTQTINAEYTINNKEDILKRMKDVVEACRKAYDATLELAEHLKNSKGSKRQKLAVKLEKQLQQMRDDSTNLLEAEEKKNKNLLMTGDEKNKNKNEVFKYEGIDTKVIESDLNNEKKTESMSSLIRKGVSGLSNWFFSKERRLKNEYLKAEENLAKTMNTERTINNKSDMLKMNKDITEAYRKAYDATLKMAEYLKKSNDPKRQELTSMMGRQLQQMQSNRGHLTSMMQKGIDEMSDPKTAEKAKELYSKKPDEFLMESKITKFKDIEEFGSGTINTVFKAKDTTIVMDETGKEKKKEKDVIIKPGNMFLKHEDRFNDSKIVAGITSNPDPNKEDFNKVVYWLQHDKIGYDDKKDLFTVEKARKLIKTQKKLKTQWQLKNRSSVPLNQPFVIKVLTPLQNCLISM
jgi:hypothetical protein